MRFLVTGGSGFIGFALVEALTERFGKENLQILCSPAPCSDLEKGRLARLHAAGFEVIEFNLADETSTLPQLKPFDVVFHLAAFTETETRSNALRVNDRGTERLLEQLAGSLLGKHFIFTSSLATVDRATPSDQPQVETDACTPRTEYGMSKLVAEQMIKVKAPELSFDYTIIRLPTVCGPGFRRGGDVCHDCRRSPTRGASNPIGLAGPDQSRLHRRCSRGFGKSGNFRSG